jgi:hypothetical protein
MRKILVAKAVIVALIGGYLAAMMLAPDAEAVQQAGRIDAPALLRSYALPLADAGLARLLAVVPPQ